MKNNIKIYIFFYALFGLKTIQKVLTYNLTVAFNFNMDKLINKSGKRPKKMDG